MTAADDICPDCGDADITAGADVCLECLAGDGPPPCADGPCSRCGGRGALEPDLDDCAACDTTGHRCVEVDRARFHVEPR